ncbi:zinc finger CCHC domain-containing protein 7-like isoform X2 [Daphnia pulex]|uniref:zinc finger CCHC domain-containing protein 7-like isoform X2 n=1 Tax=Daphnia pulex TaxID=6669 RepID=UPI001EE03042|nr:zinc finger CCHC domain-containing protein 7-like isoform X2 [Daphnia pulex]
MEMNVDDFSMTSDYCSIDELDSEAREDLEVALYGMLHHASNDEEHFINSSSNTENTSSLPTVNKASENASPHAVNYSPKLSSKDKSKAVILASATPTSVSSNRGSRQSGKKSEYPKQAKIPHPKESSNSSKLKNPCEVITLSDEEDSKYASINKSSKLSAIKRGLQASVMRDKGKNFPEMSLVTSIPSSVEGSESDSSITVLPLPDPPPGPSYLNLDSTDSSDSDVEVLKPSKINYGKVNIKLNVSQPDIESSLFTSVNPSETALNWEKYSSTKWTPEMIKFYDKDGFDRDLDCILKSFPKNVKWYLDIEDRRGTDLQRNRYFGKSAKMRCTNCNQWDHVARYCTEARKIISCSICGMPGHKQFGCPKKICLGCGRPSKILIECCPECRREKDIVCMICRSKHVTQRCPDLWRRYHSTTSDEVEELNNTGNTLKPRNELYCCNCSSRGHLVHECPEKRWSKYVPSNPTICSYENPRQFLNNVTSNGKSSVSISEDKKEVWVIGTNGQYQSPKKGGRLTHTMHYPLDSQPSEHSMQAARNSIFREIKHVEISWRKQLKKGRMLVEFSGHGDTKEAKNRFKKLVTFKRKAESRNISAKDESNPRSPSKLVKETKLVAPKVLPFFISAIDINHVSREGKHMHRHIPVSMSEKEKRNVGKLLAKLEFKHRVQITSCYVGKKWEVTIHKLPNGNPLSAVNSIVSYLDASSTRPGGA